MLRGYRVRADRQVQDAVVPGRVRGRFLRNLRGDIGHRDLDVRDERTLRIGHLPINSCGGGLGPCGANAQAKDEQAGRNDHNPTHREPPYSD